MMVCVKNYVLAVKANGKILREQDGTVALPFGQEFELICKNLNSSRAMVTVSIDGKDVADGRRLIISPNGSVTLSRYIRNGNLESGNAFRFIKRSAKVEAHRGVTVDDGLVKAEFFTEQEIGTKSMTVKELADVLDVRAKDIIAYLLMSGRFVTLNQELDVDTVSRIVQNIRLWLISREPPLYRPDPYYPPPPFAPRPRWPEYPRPYRGPMMGNIAGAAGRPPRAGFSSGPTRSMSASIGAKAMRSNAPSRSRKLNSFVEQERSANTAGITVPGSEITQRFQDVSGFPLETQTTVIVLQLRGEVGGVAVAEAVTVDRKPECVTCGKTNKATNKFCSECGTALQLI